MTSLPGIGTAFFLVRIIIQEVTLFVVYLMPNHLVRMERAITPDSPLNPIREIGLHKNHRPTRAAACVRYPFSHQPFGYSRNIGFGQID
jgi:hypothetical protein